MKGALRDRGSRKHVLDLVTDPVRFVEITNGLLAGTGLLLNVATHHRPFGRQDKAAWGELELEDYLQAHPVVGRPPVPQDWWIKYRNPCSKRPTWDLIAHLTSTERQEPGLLLVEAKAHVTELAEQDRKSQPNPNSPRSLHNDTQIRNNLAETETVLNRAHRTRAGRFVLSADTHYQLANRLACSVKLANLGYHVALLYLGFCGDTYFDDYISDRDHWQRAFGGYLQGVVPQTFPRQLIKFTSGGSLRMLSEALDVLEPSQLVRRVVNDKSG